MTLRSETGRAGVLALAALLASAAVACTSCRRSGEGGESAPPAAASAGTGGSPSAAVAEKASRAPSATSEVDTLLWGHAKDGDEEDLAALATHVGAAGLAEAAREPDKRLVALRAAPNARGYAHVAWLAREAAEAPDEEAALALDALAAIGSRPRRAEEHEDEEELAEGCTKLAALANDERRPRERRVGAIRAARTLPCPKLELPTSLDAR